MLYENRRSALCTSAALLLLAGCSGGGSQTPNSAIPQVSQPQQTLRAAASTRFDSLTGRVGLPAGFAAPIGGVRETSPGWLSEEAMTPEAIVYVTDDVANAVYIYKAKLPTAPIGTITKGLSEPLGNFVDAGGNLYVANIGTNSVTVYPPGKTAPSKTYTSGLTGPIGVAVGSDGTIYVSEFESNEVVEYYKGKTTPSLTLSVNEPEGVALDASNNLYVSYNGGSGGAVLKFKPKAKTGTDLGISVEFTGDVKLNKKNDIILEDQIAQTVNFYKPGATSPYQTIAVGADAYKLALNSYETSVYVATVNPAVNIYGFATGKLTGSITSGLQSAFGVSLSPAAPPED
jgi:hypothetical protein